VRGFIPSHFPSFLSFLLGHNLASPCFGREPKARVATIIYYSRIRKFDKEKNILKFGKTITK
jgi:hypothetical protein